MEIPQLRETNSGLGYNQYAYFMYLGDGRYLCIGVRGTFDMYEVGTVYPPSSLMFMENTTYDVKSSPLYGTFLFDSLLCQLRIIRNAYKLLRSLPEAGNSYRTHAARSLLGADLKSWREL